MPFLQIDCEFHRLVRTTNAIESDNARARKAVRAHGYFPNEHAALNAFEITYDGRLSAGRR